MSRKPTAQEGDPEPAKARGRYRKVEVRTWGDEKFRALSPMPPCGQGLWLFLITGPHTGPIPGLFRAGRAAMAEELGWDVEAFDKAFQEASQQGMVKADFKARVVWVPKAIRHNRPESPNVVLSWAAEFDLIPECDLKREAFEALRTSIHDVGDAFGKAFDKAFSKPSAKPWRKTMANQEQEQEQEQKQEQEQEHSFAGGAGAPPVAPTTPAAAPVVPRKPKEVAPKPPAPSTGVWDAYAAEYRNRYATDPVRNAKVNGQLSQLIARLGQDEAPGVARFYARSDDPFYVRQMHAVDYLLRDAEKLRTQWATGRTAPQAVGTGRIRAGPLTDAEREAANAAATAEAKRLYLAKRAGGDVIDATVTVIDNSAPTLELQ